MIAERRIKIDVDKQLDAMYINFLDVLSDSDSDVTSEELSLGVYRVYDDTRPYITFRYVILDLSYQDLTQISKMISVPNLKRYI